MLKGINPLLNADVLYALRAMGHGDRLVVCDTNFPADSIARQSALGELLRIDNVTAAKAIEAVLSVMPLDTFVDDAAIRMEIVGQPQEVPPVQHEVQAAIDRAEGRSWPLVGVERHAFYEKAKAGLLRDRDRRAPLLRLLPVQQGRHRAGRGVITMSKRGVAVLGVLRRRPGVPRRQHAGDRRDHRRIEISPWGPAARDPTRPSRRRAPAPA